MITIRRKLDIEAGHRLMKHESKCKNLHGHHYHFEIVCNAAKLDEVERIIDFSVIKQLIGGWLDENWDHGMILQKGDPWAEIIRNNNLKGSLRDTDDFLKMFLMDDAPTAENIARHLLGVSNQLLRAHGVEVLEVVCWETPNCSATATLEQEQELGKLRFEQKIRVRP